MAEEVKFEPQLTSTVVTVDGLQHWYNRGFLIPHEAIRRDMIAMKRVLQPQYFDGKLNEKWKVRNFFNWYRKYFHYMVHHHHDVEEKIYVPEMAKKFQVPPKITADHKQLVAALDALPDLEKGFQAAFDKGDEKESQVLAGRLRQEVEALEALMLPHLAEEERDLAPLIGKHLTQKEEQAIIERIIKSLGLSGNALMLPWIVKSAKLWMGPNIDAWFWTTVPAPIRWAHNSKWYPRHEQNNVALLESLTAAEDTWAPLAESSCVVL